MFGIVGTSLAIQQVHGYIAQFGPTECAVLITGETGTGKELVARALQKVSNRPETKWQAVNAAAISPDVMASHLFGHERGSFTGAVGPNLGAFGRAHGGTLFFDEVGDMPPAMQGAVLRALQEGEMHVVGGTTRTVNVRMIFATNRNLEAMVEAGSFREDLYYRVSGLVIHIPPLRERKEDIPMLALAFVERFAREFRKGDVEITPGALKLLRRHNWPGNVRELESVVRRAVLVADGQAIEEGSLKVGKGTASANVADPVVRLPADGVSLTEVKRQAILGALLMSNWVQREAAELLRISPRCINHYIKVMRIQPPPGCAWGAECTQTGEPVEVSN